MPAISPTSRPPAPAKILIVDDEPSVLQTLAAILQGAGYALALAGRGAEALAQWRDQAPDLVLLDLLLPDIDGLAVCRVIRAESTVPILVLSALGEEARQVALLDAGADDYLVKRCGASSCWRGSGVRWRGGWALRPVRRWPIPPGDDPARQLWL